MAARIPRELAAEFDVPESYFFSPTLTTLSATDLKSLHLSTKSTAIAATKVKAEDWMQVENEAFVLEGRLGRMYDEKFEIETIKLFSTPANLLTTALNWMDIWASQIKGNLEQDRKDLECGRELRMRAEKMDLRGILKGE